MQRRGQVAIVTGAASGIGAATAQRLAADGMHVIGVDINGPLLDEVVGSINATGASAHAALADVSDQTQVQRVIDEVGAAHERLDALVNCAVNFVARGLDVTPEDWDRVLGVNVQGISNIVQAAHPLLAATDHSSIVNTSSISAHIAQPARWTYNATKGAILTLTKCMALDLSADGIRVNAVSPGWIWTPEVAKAADGDRAAWEPIWGRYHMLRRIGNPEEVAAAIAFLSSSDASFITATELPVDGGYLAMGPEGLGESSLFAGANPSPPTKDSH